MRSVLVIGGLDAPRRVRRRARRGDPAPATVETTRVTVIDAAPLGDLDSADAWLSRAVGDASVSADALAVANLAVAAHRLASGDPWRPDAALSWALVWRIGYGTGEQVADGEWESARDVPLPRPKRSMISPEERVAAVLGGREVALACEELALRARGDLQHGRTREAALQLSVALDAALAELEVWRDTLAPRLDELAGLRDGVQRAGAAALQGGLEPDSVAAVEAALGRLEAALRARTAPS
ncbi:MAG TPA: hypothetical protein VFX51_23915 [Solirubrobacteraceae bacterium]|nr:hypothetical protein [Solirubrobacteraceae bacterium]